MIVGLYLALSCPFCAHLKTIVVLKYKTARYNIGYKLYV